LSPAVKAAVALVLARSSGKTEKALFIRRAAHPRDPWSGQIALPGGRREGTDVDAIDTAIRETQEETGLQLKRENAVGRLPDTTPRGKGLPKVVIRPVLFRIPKKKPVHSSPEVQSAFWIDLKKLRAARGRAEVIIQGEKKRVDAYLIDDKIIWGATFRILEKFFKKLPA
jgi:8-oxo-dGTP pyrophosphatase MutT (NUDIX family)